LLSGRVLINGAGLSGVGGGFGCPNARFANRRLKSTAQRTQTAELALCPSSNVFNTPLLVAFISTVLKQSLLAFHLSTASCSDHYDRDVRHCHRHFVTAMITPTRTSTTQTETGTIAIATSTTASLSLTTTDSDLAAFWNLSCVLSSFVCTRFW
jgi:hypothetical protein